VKEFQHIQNATYKTQDIADNTLTQARKRKSDKYKAIEENMKNWLGMYKEEIKQKYHLEKIDVKTYYIVISSLGVLQTQTYRDFNKLLRIKDPDKR
jgi:CRISPR/Cas system type I-B associated protein Csh2 (Cas7 group RAMP superfamily)